MIEEWRKDLRKRSGNLTTNEVMPEHFVNELLQENDELKNKFKFSEVSFPKLPGLLSEITGLDILAGLQKYNKDGCLTLFRAIRFPTYKRMHEMMYEHGHATKNYEQERILELYKSGEYYKKREEVKSNPLFWIQLQERVVHGLPLFSLVNDALQIHRAYRLKEDRVVMVAIHIPHELLESGKIKLISNPAIDLDFDNEEREFEIKDFKKNNGTYEFDFKALRARGIDLHEMYSKDLPWNIREAEKIGVMQDFFLLDISKIFDYSKINQIKNDTQLLKDNSQFLHGFFGDQSIISRRKTEYLPTSCKIIKKNEK